MSKVKFTVFTRNILLSGFSWYYRCFSHPDVKLCHHLQVFLTPCLSLHDHNYSWESVIKPIITFNLYLPLLPHQSVNSPTKTAHCLSYPKPVHDYFQTLVHVFSSVWPTLLYHIPSLLVGILAIYRGLNYLSPP